MRLTEFTKYRNHSVKGTRTQPLNQLKRVFSMSDVSEPGHPMFTIKQKLTFSRLLSYHNPTLSYRQPARFRIVSICHERQAGVFFISLLWICA
jgi:hypothetical protein